MQQMHLCAYNLNNVGHTHSNRNETKLIEENQNHNESHDMCIKSFVSIWSIWLHLFRLMQQWEQQRAVRT